MSAEETLKLSEQNALEGRGYFHADNTPAPKKKKKISSATIAILGLIGVAALILTGNSNSPSDISDRLVEATDVQYSDSVESKKIVLGSALESGDLPDDTTALFKESGYLVGYVNENGEFVEQNKGGMPLSLKKDDTLISASEFVNAATTDVKLYDAMNKATYGRAAYYYDDAAKKVFRELGISRNSYDNDYSFEAIMDASINNGSTYSINGATKHVYTDEDSGETVTYYELSGQNASSTVGDAYAFIDEVSAKNTANNSIDATLNTADSLKVADTISKEQRSSAFYVTFMENISKMKAGGDSRINEAMNYLHTKGTSTMLDVTTGETITVTGTPVESPSLYAILSGESFSASSVQNYSSDRILKTVENNLNLAMASEGDVKRASTNAIQNTVASAPTNLRNTIGRLLGSGVEMAISAAVAPLVPTISSSLLKTSFSNISGVAAGEFLVEGAVNVGRKLAVSGSGATAGDAAAVIAYQKLTNDILAMDAAADRLNRSPFDITSKNTFLGSIVHQFATFFKPITASSALTTFASITNNSLLSLLPGAYADEVSGYLTNFGNCETYATIGAVGTGHCSEIAVFDTSTLNAMSDAGFEAFVNQNTTLSNGVRTINPNSTLAKFIKYNNERTAPLGTTDGSILSDLKSSTSAGILGMLESFARATAEELDLATGAAFVNSATNTNWQEYKYAQRYVSLARATAALRQYSTDATAYQNVKYFEGQENPVVAFLNDNSIANLP